MYLHTVLRLISVTLSAVFKPKKRRVPRLSLIWRASCEHFTPALDAPSVLSHLVVFKVHIPCFGRGLKGRRKKSSSFLIRLSLDQVFFSCIVQSPLIILFFLLVSRVLNLYRLEIYPGIYRIQLAVQGVKGGSLGGLSGPAVHHDAVNILRTAGWTGQPKPRRQQVQYFLVAFS